MRNLGVSEDDLPENVFFLSENQMVKSAPSNTQAEDGFPTAPEGRHYNYSSILTPLVKLSWSSEGGTVSIMLQAKALGWVGKFPSILSKYRSWT